LYACAAVGAAFLLRLLVAGLLLRKLDDVPLWAFFGPQLPPVAASLVMAGAVTAARLALTAAGVRPGLSLFVQIPVGVAAYVAMARVIARPTWEQTLQVVRQALGRRRRRPATAVRAMG